MPSEELHRFHNDRARELGGRRGYEAGPARLMGRARALALPGGDEGKWLYGRVLRTSATREISSTQALASESINPTRASISS
jgi:hypothetical protein